MDKEKFLQMIVEKGLNYGPVVKQSFLEEYKNLTMPVLLRNNIIDSTSAKQNFEISVSDLKVIIPLLEKRIDTLLNDPDFNPFKEKLREKYPKQYGSNPFKYNNVTYYLYPKGFNIDALIQSMNSFKELVEGHVRLNKTLKFVYKE